jgi:hypothetical protein
MRANASRHSALSYEHAGKLEAQLKAEVKMLLAKAEAADKADVADGMSIPEELARREQRLKKLAEARAKIEARASERFAREQAEYEGKIAAREARVKATGKKPRGKPPALRPEHSVRERGTLGNQPPRDCTEAAAALPHRQPLQPVQPRPTKRNAACHHGNPLNPSPTGC